MDCKLYIQIVYEKTNNCFLIYRSLIVLWRNHLRSFNVISGERLTDYDGVDDSIVNVHFNPNNSKILMACSKSGNIICWKWKTELLIFKSKLTQVEFDCIKTFHVFSSSAKVEECEILASWVFEDSFSIGIFDTKKCKKRKNLHLKIKTNKYHVNVGGKPGNNFVALIERNKLQYLRLNKPESVSKFTIGNKRTFTCVACHPEFSCIATGDSSGRILLWQNIFSNSAPTQCTYHWHTLPVNCISFSTSGSEFYSGADECVLVKWYVDKPLQKNFLPRLPAPIKNIVTSPDNLLIAVCTEDNGIRLLDSQFNLKCLIQHLVWGAPFQAGLNYDPNTKTVVLNGRTGYLQFYSPNDQSLLYSVSCVFFCSGVSLIFFLLVGYYVTKSIDTGTAS